MDHTRDPCPWVILNDFGGAFAMGAIGGTIWHGIKGYRNSPYGERRIGAISAIKMRAPVLGGNFGVWGGLFSTFDCAVKGVRQKEDPWNSITAGFFTGGALAIRGGYKAARNGAIGCALLLAVIEGVGIGFQKMFAGSTKLEVSLAEEMPTRGGEVADNAMTDASAAAFGRESLGLKRTDRAS
ncbi:mitochondrial import inner membrane translocase subunit TIM-17 [Colletotrichum tofieldiae]|nr:mitochondrial import inner membrane translocase subunit TIM-17 [Colletotrichum tofieldiae]GKT91270.1 mitochondrial import inner membrane translocase subunit TIM17 [Colletotrichum tofieldiae]